MSHLHLSAAAVLLVPSLLLSSASAATNVAVFNFQMTSDTPDWRWLEKGLADRIATDFVQDRSLSVVARDEMQMVAQKMNWVPEMATSDPRRMKDIKRGLKITQLVTGVYSVTGEEIRITGQVVDVESRSEVARKEVTGKASDVLDLQRRLSAELLSWFSKQPPAQILKTLPVWTRSLPAAKALYEGMDLYDQGRYGEAWLKFRQASRKDPAYVEAEYWVGKMYYFMHRYEHARRALERFVYLDAAHPRMGDAMVEYVHTYEATGAPADALLTLYDDMARRFPNAAIWQGRAWGQSGALRSDHWFRYKRIHVLKQLHRNQEAIDLWGPVFGELSPKHVLGCPVSYGVVSLMDHHVRTGQMLPYEVWWPSEVIVLSEKVTWLIVEEGERPWVRFDEKGSAVTVRTVPRRLVGVETMNRDRTAAFDVSWASFSLGLEAPSGYVFTSLDLRALGEGKDGYLEMKLRRPDNKTLEARGWTPAERAPFPDACSKGIRFTAPPRLGMLIARCRFAVSGAEGGPIHVKGVRVEATLARIDHPGTLDVSCRNTSDFCVYVDGAMMRWYPGLVGPLAPGTHEVRLVPVGPGTPYGEWSTTVTVKAGETARLEGHLPWAEGNPWSAWTAAYVGTPVPAVDPGLWQRGMYDPPAIQVDDKAIRLVWPCRGDLWSSVSTDGTTFAPARKLDLPVSSGWNEFAPSLARDESGRFVLVFLSDRDAQHRNLPYACWSRDFVHWTAPARMVDEGLYDMYGLFTDDRGRLVVSCRTAQGHRMLISSDGYQWESKPMPGRLVTQDRTGRLWCYDLKAQKQKEVPYGTPPPFRCQLISFRGKGGGGWSAKRVLARFDLEGDCPGDVPEGRISVLQGEQGPVLLGHGEADKWSLGLCEPEAGGKWRLSGLTWGVVPGPAWSAYHPRWGYLIAAVGARGHVFWPRELDGPYVLRGPGLNPLREYRNPLPPLAYQEYGAAAKRSRTSFDKIVGMTLDQKIHKSWPCPSAPKAPEGTLVYVPMFHGKRRWLRGSEHFGEPSPGCGTVHPQVRVVTLRVGDQNVSIALDADKADAPFYDVIRLDLTGKGDFHDALRIPRIYLSRQTTKAQQKEFKYQFAERFPSLSFGGRQIAAGVFIEYKEGDSLGSSAELGYCFSTCAVAECRFGDKVYKVRFYDRGGNLSVRDAEDPRNTERPWFAFFDAFYVDCYGDGNKLLKFTNVRRDLIRSDGRLWAINRERIPRAIYSQPVLVDGRWWDVRVSDDGCRVSAEPCTRPMAWIQLEHPFWKITLFGEDSLLWVQGGKEPVPVPAGQYKVYFFKEYLAPDPDFTSDVLEVNAGSEQDLHRERMTLDLKAGTTTRVQLGSPIRARARVTQKSGALLFKIDVTDVAGWKAHARHILHNRAPIRVVLTDPSGRQAGTFEATNYYELKNRGWKIPPGFRGTYTVTLEFPGNFPTEPDPVTFTIH